MYERFTDACRQVVRAANREAMLTDSRYISSGHVLIALASADSDPIGELLRSFGAEPEKIRVVVSRLLQTEKQDLPESPHFKHVVGYMLDMAKRLDHEYIGTEHLLLGLLNDRDQIAVRALEAAGIDVDRLQAEATQQLPAGSPEVIARKKALEEQFGNHPEVLRLKQQINQLQLNLEQAVVARDFEKAAAYRDERVAVWEQLQQLLVRLGEEDEV
ncbi:MAG: UvrB/UvrC motif-containing protein [Pirellulales bacterium]|nr:UvrB/UvrC motif-containing protein [Pirellulales bacterium]